MPLYPASILYMETEVKFVFLVLMLMISQKIHAANSTTDYETPPGALHAANVTKTAVLSVLTLNTQFPPTTVAPDKVPGTVGVSPSSLAPLLGKTDVTAR